MSERFDVLATPIEGLAALRRHPHADARGFLERLYCSEELAPVLGEKWIMQINRTLTHRAGTIRGLHFQRAPHAETKIVSCVKGSVFDVAVDLRRGSPSFLAWHGRILSAENSESLVVPEGFAHAFQTLEPDCELLYLHTAPYAPQSEGGLDALDPRIAISWPQASAERSYRDAALQSAANFEGIVL